MSPTPTPDLIAAVGDRLTPAERRIAEAVLAEPTLLAFGTVSDLAGRVGTSRPSIVRFANKLGFDGYTQLQEHVRRGLSQRLARPSDRIRKDDAMLPARALLEGALASVFGERGALAQRLECEPCGAPLRLALPGCVMAWWQRHTVAELP